MKPQAVEHRPAGRDRIVLPAGNGWQRGADFRLWVPNADRQY